MFTQTLLPDTLRAIKLAASVPVVKRAYLAGGTALALQLGHRISIDLDFFTQEEFDEKAVATQMRGLSQFKEERVGWRTILGRLGKTRFSIFYYQYRLLEKCQVFEGIQVASNRDIAAMKLQAISDRGTKRDFIDLYFLAKEFSLESMLSFYDQKYGSLEERLYHLIKSLGYFDDAEGEDMPQMLVSVDWEEVKAFFRKEVRRLAQEKLLSQAK